MLFMEVNTKHQNFDEQFNQTPKSGNHICLSLGQIVCKFGQVYGLYKTGKKMCMFLINPNYSPTCIHTSPHKNKEATALWDMHSQHIPVRRKKG